MRKIKSGENAGPGK